ncbi:PBAN-type neuropeptides-like [Aethina tumida]|uniref:PBAN-type neuropeptides-like n=1 Tax=Aethina tumida TaxID=116153 RepID=UPI0021479ED0|nr:PBAN-type neuropeptides-like [Aethina tumida]
MSQLALTCTILMAMCLHIVLAAPSNDVTTDKRNQKTANQMWFGPRLGRRKRTPTPAEGYYDYLEADEIQSILEAIEGSPYSLVVMNPNRHKSLSFAPRLGRESGEESDEWMQVPRSMKKMLHHNKY